MRLRTIVAASLLGVGFSISAAAQNAGSGSDRDGHDQFELDHLFRIRPLATAMDVV
jgi:hypothetical protein